MVKRAEIFTQEHLQALPLHNPFLLLFQKQDWQEYLELLSLIYGLIEEKGPKVDFDLIRALIEDFYSRRDLSSVTQKRIQFVTMSISELGVFKDSHDASGKRYIEATREGRSLLKLCEGLILNRRKFTGTGADTLLGALNSLLSANSDLTLDEAIAVHEKRIKEYEDDITRMKQHGVASSELLSPGFSSEELYTQAEDAASSILAAGEDVKVAIEKARRSLMARYREKDFSVGQAIEYVADFYESLRSSPEFASFTRAKDILSFIDGLGGRYDHKDVSRIFHSIREAGVVDGELLRQSFLGEFSRRFQGIVQDIEEKIREQLGILRTQVHYVIMGESRRTQAELNELVSLLMERGKEAESFLSRSPYSISAGVNVDIGALRLHPLEIEKDNLNLDVVSLNQIDAKEMAILMEMLQKAEEATISEVIRRLNETLSRHGEILLSKYQMEFGIIEFYVLSRVEHFCEGISSEPAGMTDLEIRAHDRSYVLSDVEDRIIRFAS